MTIKLAISGCCGRMGRSIALLAAKDPAFALTGAVEATGHEALGRDLGVAIGHASDLGVRVVSDARAAFGASDVIIEFTAPDVTVSHAQLARDLRKPMVVGTTGLSDAQLQTLRLTAETVPVLLSPNMSPGVNVLFELAQLAAERLAGYDVEVVESHHKQKKDAPSGTAKRLAELLAAARKQLPGAIPVHAIRAGDIVGDHTVILAGPSERVELTHRAHDREVFSQGALRAARFVAKQPPGLYDMSHVLKGKAL